MKSDSWRQDHTTNNTEFNDSNPCPYTSQYQDNTTGLYQFGARYLDPTVGRFTQTDPSGQEANTYLYTGGNPCILDGPRLVFGTAVTAATTTAATGISITVPTMADTNVLPPKGVEAGG